MGRKVRRTLHVARRLGPWDGEVFCRGPHHDRAPTRITGACSARPTSVEFQSGMDEAQDYLARRK
jgi:hypothetical protein